MLVKKINNAAKVKNRIIVLLMIMGAFVSRSYCQTDTAVSINERAKIELIARPLKDSIMLRWGPNNSLIWEEANKAGYFVERITLWRNNGLLPKPEHQMLTATPFKPAPLANWESAVKRNKYAAIAAQALYGKTFEMDNKAVNNVYTVITKVHERDSRFSFALFAADQSPEVAKLEGLWFTDVTARKGEKYLYKVYLANPKNKALADTGMVYTGTDEYQPLPIPIDLKATFTDHKAMVSWNYQYFNRVYTAYILERSGDGGKTYRPISSEPIINTTPTGKSTPELFYKSDTLPENNKIYFYRVKGINSFGETGGSSEAISGAGHAGISFTPYITEKNIIDSKKVSLKWEYPEDKNAEIAGFKIARSTNDKSGFKYIVEKIAPDKREASDEKPGLNNYYIVSAYNAHGEEVRSAPVFVPLIDSIPPAPPMGLKGSIDSTGKVTLCWKANTEDDMYGYRIYRANYATEEFSQVTTTPIAGNCFKDSVSLKTLTKSVFYMIMAIDQRQNHSGFSEPAEIKRPNKNAPVSPVFTAAKSSPEGVYLEWVNSTSDGLKQTLLYRSIPGSQDWKLIAAFEATDSVTRYMDKGADSLDYRSYTLIAQGLNYKESKPSSPVTGKKIDTGIRAGIDKVFVNIEREKGIIQLAWKKPAGNVFRYIIYRAVDKKDFTIYSGVPGNTEAFTDEKVQPNVQYRYAIKVTFVDGSQSVFSKPVNAEF